MARKSTIPTMLSRPHGKTTKGIRSGTWETDKQQTSRTDTPSKQWSPPDGIFLLANPEALKNVRLNQGEWLGVWLGSHPGRDLFWASRSPQALYRKLKGKVINWPVSARREKSRDELSSLPARRDHLRHARRQALETVAVAQRMVENKEDLYTFAEATTARAFLRDLSNEARNKGKRRGDTANAVENQQMLDVFWEISQGKTLKQIVIDRGDNENYENRIRSFSVRMSRFSKRVNEAVLAYYRSGDQLPNAFYQHEKACLLLSILFGIQEGWAGVSSTSHKHGYALCEALNHYKLRNTNG